MPKLFLIAEKAFDLLNPTIDPEEKDDYLFAFILLSLAIALLAVLIPTYAFAGSWVEMGASAFVLVVFVFSVLLLRAGYLSQAMWIAILLAHIIHLAGMTLTRGLNDPTFHAVYLVFIGAFYFLSYRSVLTFMMIVIVWAISLYFAELFGLLSFNPIPPSSGESLIFTVSMVLLTGVILYITLLQLVQANTELREAKEAAETANLTKSSFLAMMSHELRTPLHAIIGYSDVIQDELKHLPKRPLSTDDVEEISVDLDQIKRSGRQLLSLLDDLLEVSKSEAHAQSVVLENVQIQMLCREVIDVVRLRNQHSDNRLEAVFSPDTFTVQADGQKIRLILTNLLQNAMKFTDGGLISLSASLLEGESKGSAILQFIVEDTGIGIHPDAQTRIFEPFYQADSGYTRRADGAGLGLNIAQKMVDLLGGTIDLESELGKGSKFTIRLPVHLGRAD